MGRRGGAPRPATPASRSILRISPVLPHSPSPSPNADPHGRWPEAGVAARAVGDGEADGALPDARGSSVPQGDCPAGAGVPTPALGGDSVSLLLPLQYAYRTQLPKPTLPDYRSDKICNGRKLPPPLPPMVLFFLWYFFDQGCNHGAHQTRGCITGSARQCTLHQKASFGCASHTRRPPNSPRSIHVDLLTVCSLRLSSAE